MGDLMSRAGRATRTMVAGRLRHGLPRDAHWLRDGMGRSRAAVRRSWRAMILAAARSSRLVANVARRWLAAPPETLHDAGRTLSSADAPLRRAASRDGARTAAASFFVVAAPPSPAAAPAPLRRCRDGWSEFF
ncbi:hypothetical protein F511_47302 [Dorcoceras hygrometricum]|uniref:Uncharacterized protein n=1 Tax=Dorcoceras hygrometricum TaxID=472368 RepID=A0A2Z6ZRE4_9LAMI|nr:hypothetical protein F511_47302 [Dorcoceras hygrometricum]